ncbi:MAG: hypothetical protein M1274_06855 [Actinobacteria bacterium]|nr:hypothetical protein [Actinomycetota bacterium]
MTCQANGGWGAYTLHLGWLRIIQPKSYGRLRVAAATTTNTGSDTFNCAASEFTLEGQSSGSVGVGAPGIVGKSNPTVAGEPLLKAGTLAPGRSITATVRFSLSGNDYPVKVRLGTATSTAVTLASWQ